MKKTKYFLTLLAVTTIVSAGIGKAWAYFTTYTEASGGYRIDLGDETEITEHYEDWIKEITISSKEDSEPVYIRARAFCAEYLLTYEGEGWTRVPPKQPGAEEKEDEEYWYYYEGILKGGETAPVLKVEINDVPKSSEKDPGKHPEIGDRFNVIVIYESIPVRYKTDGTPYQAWEIDWDSENEKLQVVEPSKPAEPETPENPDITKGGNN